MTVTSAQFSTEADPATLAVAQIATCGDIALPATSPAESTRASVESELDHDTEYGWPCSTRTVTVI